MHITQLKSYAGKHALNELRVSEEEMIFDFARKLSEDAAVVGSEMVNEIEVKEPDDFNILAKQFYSALERARIACNQIIDPEKQSECVIPIWNAEEKMLTKLRALFKK